MYKNVQVNHYNNATSAITSSPLPSYTNQKATSLPVQITSVFSSSSSSPSSPYNKNIGDGGISLPVSYKSSNTNMSTSSTKLKSDVDQLDDLVKDLLNEVNRPITNNVQRYSYQRYSNNDLSNPKLSSISTITNPKNTDLDVASNNAQRSKTTREERIRIKRGSGTTEPPIATSTTTTTTTTTTKNPVPSSTIDEHLIDSLLESVQNTLKKRAQKTQSNWPTDVPINNRRTYSSSAAYTDSVHRVSHFFASMLWKYSFHTRKRLKYFHWVIQKKNQD